MKRFWESVGFWLITVQMVILLLSATTALSRTIDPHSIDQNVLRREARVIKILSVLGNRMEDQEIIEKARNKLFTLSDRQFSLVASLSEKITREGNKAGSEMAFLLMTVLIALS